MTDPVSKLVDGERLALRLPTLWAIVVAVVGAASMVTYTAVTLSSAVRANTTAIGGLRLGNEKTMDRLVVSIGKLDALVTGRESWSATDQERWAKALQTANPDLRVPSAR